MSERYRQLVFRPTVADAAVAVSELAASLSELGLIGKVITPSWPHRYYIGERFLQYLNFMGCAPALAFEPPDRTSPDWSAFTFISLSTPSASVRCFVDGMLAKPACPHCGKRHALANVEPLSAETKIACPKCQRGAPMSEWDWREFGGCARQFIHIVNVYPKEALPTESLLQHLRDKTNFDWRYFYIHDVLQDVTN